MRAARAGRALSEAARRFAPPAAVYLAAAVAGTWPLAAYLASRLGAPEGPGDPYLNLWILGWDLQALTETPSKLLDGRVFDAPIFHPASDTLTYSDHLLLQALLILDTDRSAAKVVRQTQRGDVNFALLLNLLVGQFRLGVAASQKLHAALFHPAADVACFLVGNLRCFVVQCRLAQPLFIDPCRVEQMVGKDCVKHSHAAFVEHAHDGLLAHQLSRRLASVGARANRARLTLLERRRLGMRRGRRG